MERAVVLSGGMAGLLAARMPADHGREVVVVERDDLSGGPADRRGAPQGNQVHGHLAGSLELMEAMFPGLTAELAAAGAEVADPGIDCQWWVSGERKPPSGLGPGMACTRPFLEWHLHRRVTALPGVGVLRAGRRPPGHRCRVDGVGISDAEGLSRGGRSVDRHRRPRCTPTRWTPISGREGHGASRRRATSAGYDRW